MKGYYHCPKCSSNNTKRAVLCEIRPLYLEGTDVEYKNDLHGNPYVCKDCKHVFAVGIEKLPYIEHCQKAVEEK